MTIILYDKNEINTPAATAEPITPDILLAMMATAIIAHGTSRLVCPVPVYRAMAAQFLVFQKRLAGSS